MTVSTAADSRPVAGAARAGATGEFLRLTLQAPTGRTDLVVPAGATPRGLLEVLTTGVGVLCGPTGRSLEADTPLSAQGVRDGDLLVVGRVSHAAPDTGRDEAGRAPVARPLRLLALPGALAVAGVGAGWAGAADTPARIAIAAGVLLAGVLAALLPRTGLLPAAAQTLAPAFAGAAVVALLARDSAGEDVLAIVAAGVVAAQAAALTRIVAEPGLDAALLVWLWSAVAVAAVGAAVMVADGSPRVVWAVLLALAVAASALLPRVAVDAPDEQLLDADRMAATAWTVRSAGVRGTRSRVRPAEVAAAVDAGRRLLDAGAVAVALVAGATSIALALDPGTSWSRWFAFVAGALAGVALAIGSRSYGGLIPRIALRLGGLVAVLAAAGGLLAAADTLGLVIVAVACPVLALPALLAGIGLGHGWRSVWWARLGDLAGSAAMAFTLPAAALAAGGFEHFRQLLS